MIRKFITKLRPIIYLIGFYLVGCTKNVENLPLNEQAIYLPSRFSSDIAKDRYRKPLEILNFSEVSPGMKVVDLLGGSGYYSELFNHIIGNKGQVYLQNNSLFLRFSAEEIKKRLENNRLQNVVRLDSEFADMNLPQDIDLIFIGLSFHDIYVKRDDPKITANREEFYLQIRSALKPGGLLVVIDHAANPGSGISETSKLHRIDETWLKNDITSEGFEYIGSSDVLRNPEDDYNLDIWKKAVFHKTDRFIHRYRKVATQ